MDRCPNCGRFIESEPDGFYDRLERGSETSQIVPFCNEACADQYAVKQLPDRPSWELNQLSHN